MRFRLPACARGLLWLRRSYLNALLGTIKVSAESWNGLSQDDQDNIRKILVESNLIHEGDSISADNTATEESAPEGFWCELACDAAQASATALCTGLAPVAAAACVAAATAAGNYCRSKC